MKDASTVEGKEGGSMVAGKKKAKIKTIKETNFSAGLAALDNLDSSDVATRPVALTARVLVQEGISTIVRLRSKNVPLLRIYNDMRKASGMKITFATFAGYVSDAAKRAGLKFEKVKQVPSMPASTGAGSALAVVQVDHVDHVQEKSGFNCEHCMTEAQIYESPRIGVKFWHCEKCNSFYCDDNDKLTSRRLDEKLVAEIAKK